jgi:hypothetical protein
MDYHKYSYYNKLNGLVKEYFDRIFIDSKISDLNVLLLLIFNYDSKIKVTGLLTTKAKEMFETLGRKVKNFNKCKSIASKGDFIEKRESPGKNVEYLYLTQKGINKVNELLGISLKRPVYIIKSGEKFSALKIFEEFLGNEMKTEIINLCDTHISDKTLFPFSELKGNLKKLNILTSNIYDEIKFESYKNNLLSEYKIEVEVRKSFKLHDRYILGNNKCWTLGTSLKDIGNKDTIIRENNEIYGSLKEIFDIRWKEKVNSNN